MTHCPTCKQWIEFPLAHDCPAINNGEHETARPDADFVRVQRVDMPAARWEENARALLKLALELAYEVRSRCNQPIHDEQIRELRALEAEWAGSGHIT